MEESSLVVCIQMNGKRNKSDKKVWEGEREKKKGKRGAKRIWVKIPSK